MSLIEDESSLWYKLKRFPGMLYSYLNFVGLNGGWSNVIVIVKHYKPTTKALVPTLFYGARVTGKLSEYEKVK